MRVGGETGEINMDAAQAELLKQRMAVDNEIASNCIHQLNKMTDDQWIEYADVVISCSLNMGEIDIAIDYMRLKRGIQCLMAS